MILDDKARISIRATMISLSLSLRASEMASCVYVFSRMVKS